MTRVIDIIEDHDITLAICYHDNGDVSWQLDVCAIDDLPTTGDADVESRKAAARYLRSVADELDEEVEMMVTLTTESAD